MMLLLSVLFTAQVDASPPQFLTPPRGWSALYGAPFNAVNETIVRKAAAALNSSGLLTFGYDYVNLDDWYVTGRDTDGELQVDKLTFPSGMPDLGEYIHSQGCKFGVYSSGSLQTCGSRPASMFNEARDANTYANEWKIDYLKNDACTYQVGVTQRARYFAMGRALNRTGLSFTNPYYISF